MDDHAESFWNEFAHEVRNSLHIVIGSASLLKPGMTSDGEQLIENIQTSASQLQAMLQNYLAESKAGVDKGSDHAELILTDVMINVIEQHKILAKDKTLEIAGALDSKIPRALVGPKTKLIQVLNNLVSNAIHYTAQGKICVKSEMLSTTSSKVLVRFSVEDSGPGISEEDQKKLFNQYIRLNPNSQDEGKRFGLGLSICKRLLHSVGSEIRLKSQPGQGSVFEFDLEFTRTDAVTEEKILKKIAFDNSKPKALVVDDEHLNRVLLTKLLLQFGMECDSAANGNEAMKLNESNSYSLVFLDLNLPDYSGWKLCEMLRKTNPEIRAVLTSGDINALYQHEKLDELGIETILAKPFTRQDLEKVILNLQQ